MTVRITEPAKVTGALGRYVDEDGFTVKLRESEAKARGLKSADAPAKARIAPNKARGASRTKA